MAGSVLTTVFFARDLLIERSTRRIIFVISMSLFVVSVLLTILKPGPPTLFPSLMNPLVSLCLFFLMRKLFVRWKCREPLDTFLDWRQGLAADRWFNILYFTGGVFMMFLLYVIADLTGWRWH